MKLETWDTFSVWRILLWFVRLNSFCHSCFCLRWEVLKKGLSVRVTLFHNGFDMFIHFDHRCFYLRCEKFYKTAFLCERFCYFTMGLTCSVYMLSLKQWKSLSLSSFQRISSLFVNHVKPQFICCACDCFPYGWALLYISINWYQRFGSRVIYASPWGCFGFPFSTTASKFLNAKLDGISLLEKSN